MWLDTLIKIIGGFGFGIIVKTILDKYLEHKYRIENFYLRNKYKSIVKLSKDILSMSLAERKIKQFPELFRDSAEARLFINNRKLDGRIHQFLIDIDLYVSNCNRQTEEECNRLQKESKEIFSLLKDELKRRV